MTGNDTTRSRTTKPNCTITHTHDDMLDVLADEWYASRSAALRAAIELLVEEKNDDEDVDSDFEFFAKRIESLTEEIRDVKETLADIESAAQANMVSRPPATNENMSMSGESPTNSSEVFKALDEFGPSTLNELAGYTGSDLLTVRKVINQLREEGFVDEMEDADDVTFCIAQS